MIGNNVPDRSSIMLEDNIIEEVEYLTDSNDVLEEEEESDWDASTLSAVVYTPSRIECPENIHRGFSPLAPSSLSARREGSNLLDTLQSPPESKLRRPQFESFGVDNRTRIPSYTEYALSPTSEEDNDIEVYEDDEDDVADIQMGASSMSYGASKYLPRLSSSMTQQPMYNRRSRMSLESPANKSCASIQSTSSLDSRRYSMMSMRSSTSMSMLFGEVINLEDRSRFGDSQAAKSPLPSCLHDVDLENGLEGIEIGGGTRPERGLFGAVANRTWVPPVVRETTAQVLHNSLYQAKLISHITTRGLQTVATRTYRAAERVIHSYHPPLSPRARALEDLEYLQKAHKEKVGQFTENPHLEEHFDFVLLLKPQEVYRFWAELLDFRVEYLGDEVTMDLEADKISPRSTQDSSDEDDSTELDLMRFKHIFSTPNTGIRRRVNTPITSTKSPLSPLSRLYQSIARESMSNTVPSPANVKDQSFTPGRMKQRQSMFEKAVNCNVPASPVIHILDDSTTLLETPMQDSRNAPSTVQRRRWGNRAVSIQRPSILSPPVRSLTRGGNSVRKVRVGKILQGSEGGGDQDCGDSENFNPNRSNLSEEYPNPVIPRGVAARTNGMLPFLSALKRGIVVRRHRANKDAVYCKIFSNDGGDTIQYQLIDTEEAMVAFKEQRVRYNRHITHSSSPNSVRASSRDWACMESTEDGDLVHKFNVPDHVAAHRYREKLSRESGLKKKVMDIAIKAANSGIIRAADLVAVHPASHVDPRHPGVRQGALGTATLRKSKSEFYTPHTFSIVVNVGQRFAKNKMQKNTRQEPGESKWYTGEGNDLQFKILDFEAATTGEYWLIFRGFLLLQRDVVVGRFAAERRAGIGGGNRNHNSIADSGENTDNSDEIENLLHRDEFLEPVTVGLLERAVVKCRKLDTTYMEGAVSPNAVPPPSDYFLGFKSPGTQIWSRLRLAGLETTRVYSVDTRRVMIKIRCPEDRLTDVAEVLRVKMKTLEGKFTSFREDIADRLKPLNDPCDVPPIYRGQTASLLRSKDRQNIIDFIIGSRIRDSGAELGPTTDVGKMVQARVPLHMHEKLEALYTQWVFYWRKTNWTGSWQTILEDVVKSKDIDMQRSPDENETPNFITRFVVGAFHQPLDSIEEYFGEQVTFYFAWLQHCARHLLVLTLIGLLVTVCEVANDAVDHRIRPFFSLVVMIWTFMVLLNWRKRSNYLAYKWGSMDYKDKETPRPEFHGEYVVDEITQEWVVKYPQWKRWLKYTISVPITCFFTGMAGLLILLVHTNRDIQMANYVKGLEDPSAEPFKFELSLHNIGKETELTDITITKELLADPEFWVAVGALPAFLGLCMPIMNFILMKISVTLNDFENYRTESEYRTHLIIKVFSFRFVSQLGTLYYYAVIAMTQSCDASSIQSEAALEECRKTSIQNGMIRMGTSIMVYTTVAHWWTIFLQVYFFMFIRNIRRFLYRRKLRQELKKIEIEEQSISSDLSDAEARQICLINKRVLLDQAQDDIWFELMNPPHDSFPEYITAVVQFSFVACFSVVLPITPIFCLVNYLLSMRFDAYKLCRGRRRPLAKKTGGIGIWEHLLHIVVVIAVFTNCWLMTYTSSLFENVGDDALVAIVVAWEHVMLLIKYVMQTSMSPLPKIVRDELKRQQHTLEKEQYTAMRTKDHDRRGKMEKNYKPSNVSVPFGNEHQSETEHIDNILHSSKINNDSPEVALSFDNVSETDTVAA